MSRGKHWSEDDLNKLGKLFVAGVGTRDIAAEFPGRNERSVLDAIKNHRHKWSTPLAKPRRVDLAPPIAPEAPKPDVDRAYLRAVLKAGGFPWLRPVIAERFYALEAAPKTRPEFWRGHGIAA